MQGAWGRGVGARLRCGRRYLAFLLQGGAGAWLAIRRVLQGETETTWALGGGEGTLSLKCGLKAGEFRSQHSPEGLGEATPCGTFSGDLPEANSKKCNEYVQMLFVNIRLKGQRAQ